jgi:Flp pilus assembly pilin Flp
MWWFRKGNRRASVYDDRGVTSVEYGLIFAGVGIIAVPGFLFLQGSLGGTFETSVDESKGVCVGSGCPAAGTLDPIQGYIPPGAPTAPTSVAVTSGSPQAMTVTWAAPTSSGDGPVVFYTVQRALAVGGVCPDDSSGTWGSGAAVTAPTATYTYAGLAAGSYCGRVKATNSVQASGPYASAGPLSVVGAAATAPTEPRNVAGATTASRGEVVVTWQVPASDGGSPLTSYLFQYATTANANCPSAGSASWIGSTPVAAGNLTRTVTSLPTGGYCFRVSATNQAGLSSGYGTTPSVLQVTGIEAPSTPQTVTVNVSTREQASVQWVAPSTNGGAPVTLYNVEYVSTSNANCPANGWTVFDTAVGTSVIVTPLTGGSYCFRVSATNSASLTSGWATVGPAAVTAYTAPSAPRNVTGSSPAAGVGRVTWQVPSDLGGYAAVSGYSVQYAPGTGQSNNSCPNASSGSWTGAQGVGSAVLSYDFTLAVGKYCYRVRASNDSGNGSYAATASSVQVN